MNRPNPTRRWGLPALAAACALAFALSPSLRHDATPISGNADAFAPGVAGLRAAIDPETGELALGADAMRLSGDKAAGFDLRQALSRSDVGLVKVVRPDGGASVNLQGRFMSTSVARLTPDGGVETLCTHDADEAESFLRDRPAAGPSAGPASGHEVDAHGREVR